MVSTDQSSLASRGAKLGSNHVEDAAAKQKGQPQDMEMMRPDSDEDHEREPKVIHSFRPLRWLSLYTKLPSADDFPEIYGIRCHGLSVDWESDSGVSLR